MNKNMKSERKRKKQKIHKKISFAALLTVVMSALSLVIIGAVTYSLSSNFGNLLSQSVMTGVERASAQITSSVEGRIAETVETLDVLKNKLKTDAAALDAAASSTLEIDRNVNAVIIYDEEGGVIKYWSGRALKSSYSRNLSDYRAQSPENEYYFSPIHVQNIFEESYPWVFTASSLVQSSVYGKVYFSADLTLLAVSDAVDGAGIGSHGYCYIVDSSGGTIYHPRRQLIASGAKAEENIPLDKEGVIYRGDTAYTVSFLNKTEWRLVTVSYPGELSSAYNRQMLILIAAVCGTALIVSWVIARILSERLSGSVKVLSEEMSAFEKDIYGYKYLPEKSLIKEVNGLSESFGVNVRVVQELLKEVETKQRELHESQLETLRNQINPHFLYNTLDSIVWMCKMGKSDEAAEMTSALAKLFRIGISRGKKLILVAKEAEHAECYLKIQSMRFKNKFDYKIDITPEALACRCNKIILQPFIENAIKHGIIDGEKLHITVTGRIEGDEVIFTVADDGCGISAEKLEKIRAGSCETMGIGIKNVDLRVKMCFGERYGATIDSIEDEGTTVTIRLPRNTEEYKDAQG